MKSNFHLILFFTSKTKKDKLAYLCYGNIFCNFKGIYCLFISTMNFIGRVTLLFANNYLTEYRITMKF